MQTHRVGPNNTPECLCKFTFLVSLSLDTAKLTMEVNSTHGRHFHEKKTYSISYAHDLIAQIHSKLFGTENRTLKSLPIYDRELASVLAVRIEHGI